ncbi:MAG: HAD family hydrolase [Patescibacteria group bacterium]
MADTTNFKKHFVFDLDDTLIDGRLFCGESMARAITQLEPHVNSKLVVDFHESVRGATIEDLYKMAIEEFGLKSKLEDLLRLDADIQMKEFPQMRLFDGVVDILKFLRESGKTLHVCTNRTMRTLEPILQGHAINGYFEEIISCADAGYKKPDSKCLLDLVSRYGGDKRDFIYFGDSEVDSEFAKNAGIEFIIFDQYLNNKNLFKKLINMFLEKKINGMTF